MNSFSWCLYIWCSFAISQALPDPQPRMFATRVITVTELKTVTQSQMYFSTCYIVPDGLSVCDARRRSLDQDLLEPVLILANPHQIAPSIVEKSIRVQATRDARVAAQTDALSLQSSQNDLPTLGMLTSGNECLQGRYFLLTLLSTATVTGTSVVFTTQTGQNTVTYSIAGCKAPGGAYSPPCEP